MNPRDGLVLKAKKVLEDNDLGDWTRPAPALYPHQWLWDSCFIAIGLARYAPGRAKAELKSLVRGQWKNGMLPHIIFSENEGYHAGPWLWQSEVAAHAPDGVSTTGITQPPVLAEAITRVAAQLKNQERTEFLGEMYPALLAYHQWMYRERNPNNDGLVVLVHSWESGMDNSPPWMREVKNASSLGMKTLEKIPFLENVLTHTRKDNHYVPVSERLTAADLYRLYEAQKRLKTLKYDNQKILENSKPLIIDVAFISILVRANRLLEDISKELAEKLPHTLQEDMSKTEKNLETLWYTDRYYHRDYLAGGPILDPTIASLLPLYAGTISQSRAEELVSLLDTPGFASKWTIPTVPVDSPSFIPRCYWQGPVWLNMNWMMIDGLNRYGYTEKAAKLQKHTLELVEQSGIHEYYSPLNGKGSGAHTFSWTAALTIDLLNHS